MDEKFNDKLIENGVWERICNIEKALGMEPNQKFDKSVITDIERINETIKDLQSLEERNKTLENDVKTQSDRIMELESEKQEQAASIQSLKKEKTTYEKKIEELETEKQEQAASIQSLKDEKTTYEKKIEELETENREQAISIQLLKTEKINLESKVSNLESDCKIRMGTIEELTGTNKNQEETIGHLKNENKAFQDEIGELQNTIKSTQNAWDTSILEYKKLLLLMYKCKSLSRYVKGFGMDETKEGNDFQSVVSFISLFGNQMTFAGLLYSFYEGQATKLDADDCEFIKAINLYYRKRYGITYDVLVIPEGGNERFDKEMMKDKEKPNDVFSKISEVYAPAVMRNEKAVEKRMIVKGEKS